MAAFFTLWIVLPAPLYALWIVGIAGTELSLWWGLLGVAATVLGILARRAGAWQAGGTAAAFGLFAMAVSLVPLLQSLPTARRNGVALSVSRFFSVASGGGARPETVTYAKVAGQSLRLDVYRAMLPPATGSGPAVIVVHGGSWSAGDKSDFAHWDRWLAAQGYTVFDIQYRLSPQPNWREATGDVKDAVVWVKRNAQQYRVDPSRIALLGRSAGGHLALLSAYLPGDGINSGDAAVCAVVSLYGPTDLAWGYYHTARPDVIDGPEVLRRFLGGDPAALPDTYAQASPVTHVGPDTPPTLLLHGERDRIVGPQHSWRLAARLAAARVPFAAVSIPYGLHGFDFNLNGWGSQIAQPVLLSFLRKHLAAKPSRVSRKSRVVWRTAAL
ncbi:MAG: alpha/beta hydrolase [Cytophagales bacterium]|nr:alpha/beta hydrolase [Armatimonadota bacterium]